MHRVDRRKSEQTKTGRRPSADDTARGDDPPRLHLEPVSHAAGERDDFAAAVRAGLTAGAKSIPCRFLYDARGSLLFERITELPEYYPTRAERSILRAHAADIARCVKPPVELVELGSGSASKTRALIETLIEANGSLVFRPIDISPTILEASSRELLDAHPTLVIEGLVGEYDAALRSLAERHEGRSRLVLWLGSSIGNLSREAAARFLARVRGALGRADRLLVGVDLRKDARVLERAYDDADGVTAAFDLNLLARINRELGGHFDLARFRHEASYDVEAGRVEMHLVSLGAQRVPIDRLGIEVGLADGEAIHTESSYKYSLAEIDALASVAGLAVEQRWLDRDGLFSSNLLRAA